MSFVNDFKSFILRGNVLDLAVGIIIGAAFTAIVSSLVDDMLMPVIGLALSGVDFSNFFINLKDPMDTTYTTLKAAKDAGVPVLAYGNFINAIIKFLIVAFAVFMLVRQVSKLIPKKDAAPAAPVTPEDVLLLREIRDSLKK